MDKLKEGEATLRIYEMISKKEYAECVSVLCNLLYSHDKSRPALSLLGYCYYQREDYVNAANCYEQLTLLFPAIDCYRLYYAQSLYRSGLLDEALKVSHQIECPTYHDQMAKLQAAIRYEQEDWTGSMSLMDRCANDDVDVVYNKGCVLFKQSDYSAAKVKFEQAKKLEAFRPDVHYSISVCCYMLKDFKSIGENITEIIRAGYNDYPDMVVGLRTEGVEMRNVSNNAAMRKTALIEAFNLRAAVHYQLNEHVNALVALEEMPPRVDEELDPVTLHNQALLKMDSKPTEGFEKLQFLLQQEVFPPETFANLLLLLIKYQCYDQVADMLAENTHLRCKFLSQYMSNFLEAVILKQTSPEDGCKKLDELASQLVNRLRVCAKQLDEVKSVDDDLSVKQVVRDFDATMAMYLPVLMQRAKVPWDAMNYQKVEETLWLSMDFCLKEEVWTLNLAHTFFMQAKYREAISLYCPIVHTNGNILQVSPIVVANLCVSYIKTNESKEAEKLLIGVEKEEEVLLNANPDAKTFHSCIMNLVIGTLYCVEGNYPFGIGKVICSFDPFIGHKLSTITWFYAKRCLLSLVENMAKHLMMIPDTCFQSCLDFLDKCERYGRNIQVETIGNSPNQALNCVHPGVNTVAFESRVLKTLLLQLI